MSIEQIQVDRNVREGLANDKFNMCCISFKRIIKKCSICQIMDIHLLLYLLSLFLRIKAISHNVIFVFLFIHCPASYFENAFNSVMVVFHRTMLHLQ